tara:strand:- start:104 stop:601 length:498 start_codon:yes stop_codon:yes gene_type:complete
MNKSKITPITLMLLLVVFVFSCGGSDVDKKKEKIGQKYDCMSIDDCLAQYKFTAARAHLDAINDPRNRWEPNKKIVNIETSYWVNQGDFNQAMTVLEEARESIATNYTRESDYNKMRYNLISSIVNKLLDKGNYKEAKRWALKIDYDKKREELLKQIKDTEKVMN